jgi:hypothetical protein
LHILENIWIFWRKKGSGMVKHTRFERRNPRLFGWVALVFLVPVAAASAQTAEKLDAVLAAKQVTFGQAAGIILPAAGLLAPDAGTEDAFAIARFWLPHRTDMNVPITMGELSHLIMKSFSLSGGFMYAIFPGPRYAYRALVWRRFLPGNADPGRSLSGEELLYITGRALAFVEEKEAGTAVKPGTGLSSGPEDIQPYQGEFQVE